MENGWSKNNPSVEGSDPRPTACHGKLPRSLFLVISDGRLDTRRQSILT